MQTTAERAAAGLVNRVPEVTLTFWTIKIMATTVGETAADLLNAKLGLGLANTSLVMAALLAAALAAQFRARRYVPSIYWVSVVLISIVGTLITDNLTDHLGVALPLGTAIFAAGLAAAFTAWYASEKTLSIHTIFTARRETFYWAAILLTFALGTAGGDLMAETMQLGYLNSALIFGAAIAAVTLGYYALGLNAVAAFWMAYILTRPFGASFGDLLSQPVAAGGLGLGTAATSGVFLAVILGLIAWMNAAQRRLAQTAST